LKAKGTPARALVIIFEQRDIRVASLFQYKMSVKQEWDSQKKMSMERWHAEE
jgi:hypothetical protein